MHDWSAKPLRTRKKQFYEETGNGRVDQFGMIAALASLRSRVQIPPRPLELNFVTLRIEALMEIGGELNFCNFIRGLLLSRIL